MKKRLMVMVMVVGMAVAGLAGCGEKEEPVSIANPWTSYETLEDVVKESGIEFNVPESLAGFDTVIYQNMGKEIVEALYSTGADEDAAEISVRKSLTEEGANGDYNEYKNESTENISDIEVTVKENDGKTFAAAFSKDKAYYYIMANKGMQKEDMLALVSDIIEKN